MTFFQGTIDKTYPKTVSGYNFEIGSPAIEKIVKNIRPGIGFKYEVIKRQAHK